MWRITLTSGAEVELWADGYTTDSVDGHWQFSVLVDATSDEQGEVRTDGHTVPPSDRCSMVVFRIPVAEVESIEGGWPLGDDPRINLAPEEN
jgi:hypothetical protein